MVSFNPHPRLLQVTPKHKQDVKGNPYVALSLKIAHACLELGHIVHAVFELSIFNHSKGMYRGCKGRLVNVFVQVHPYYFPSKTNTSIILAGTEYMVLTASPVRAIDSIITNQYL